MYILCCISDVILPDDGESLEGVGIVLDQHATATWKSPGECWEVVSSRIVTAS